MHEREIPLMVEEELDSTQSACFEEDMRVS